MKARLLWSGLILGCTACAARPSDTVAPASQQQSPGPTDLDALERDLALQEARLEQALGPRLALNQAPAEPAAGAPAAGAAPAPAPPPAPAEAAPASRAPETADDDEQAAEGERGAEAQSSKDKREEASPCETACRAVASMRRSAEAICRLSGAAHARCQHAEQRVSEAAERVERARCTCR